jgi:pyruvate/2-oxoglutarate dehydrogenase complex dihydrolipoamide dehydrogenase (E3) component
MGRLGSQVTIIEFMDQILGPEDPDIADVLQKQLKEEGIRIHTATKAVKVQYDNPLFHLTIADASGTGQTGILKAEALLVAAGRKPNIDGLGLEAAGIKFTPRGIPTDSRMKTNIKHIYACGDVNGKLLFTHVAGYEAGIALTNAILRLPRKADYAKIGWCTYTDPEIASIGYNEKRAKKDGIKYRVWEEQYAENDRAEAEGATIGKIKLLVSTGGKLLGCQIIGAHAGELIHEWVIAVNGGIKLSTIAGAVHIYPTISEISKRVTGKIFAEKIFSQRTKSILKFIFSLKGRACSPPQ